jgi:hypothetical protein
MMAHWWKLAVNSPDGANNAYGPECAKIPHCGTHIKLPICNVSHHREQHYISYRFLLFEERSLMHLLLVVDSVLLSRRRSDIV